MMAAPNARRSRRARRSRDVGAAPCPRRPAQFPRSLYCGCAAIVCVIPLSAPWLLSGRTSTLTVWLAAIAGGIVMLKAIDWLRSPGQSHELVRVWLALSLWPALQIEDVAVPLPSSERTGLVLRRFAAGSAGLVVRPRPGCTRIIAWEFPNEASWSTAPGRSLEIYPDGWRREPSAGRFVCTGRIPRARTASAIPFWPVRSSTSGAAITFAFTAGSNTMSLSRSAGGGESPCWASWLSSRRAGLLHEYLFLHGGSHRARLAVCVLPGARSRGNRSASGSGGASALDRSAVHPAQWRLWRPSPSCS